MSSNVATQQKWQCQDCGKWYRRPESGPEPIVCAKCADRIVSSAVTEESRPAERDRALSAARFLAGAALVWTIICVLGMPIVGIVLQFTAVMPEEQFDFGAFIVDLSQAWVGPTCALCLLSIAIRASRD